MIGVANALLRLCRGRRGRQDGVKHVAHVGQARISRSSSLLFVSGVSMAPLCPAERLAVKLRAAVLGDVSFKRLVGSPIRAPSRCCLDFLLSIVLESVASMLKPRSAVREDQTRAISPSLLRGASGKVQLRPPHTPDKRCSPWTSPAIGDDRRPSCAENSPADRGCVDSDHRFTILQQRRVSLSLS